MATSKKGKVVNKDDLRRLMKEKTKGAATNTKRIDSPLAKYDSLGNLYCVVCNSKVKNHLVWNAHIMGRSHKENVARLKQEQHKKVTAPAQPPKLEIPSQPKPPPAPPKSILKNSTKRKAEEQNDTPSKAVKIQGLPDDFFDSGAKKPSLGIASYDSSGDEEDTKTPAQSSSASSGPDGLPADFFDQGVVPSTSVQDVEKSTEPETPQAMAEKLPEGFFDDPKMDAKVREVEYKDKMDEEWALFQKEMKSETIVSEAIQEEDAEVIQTERDIDEADEQLYHLKKVTELAKQKDTMAKPKPKQSKDTLKDSNDSEDEIDEDDLENMLMDWRGKDAFH